MTKPTIIGISGNERPNPDDPYFFHSYAAKGYVDGVQKAGGVPIILPISQPELAKHYVDMIDKLIITGGQNVAPHFYGEEKTIVSDDYHLLRDKFELALIDECIKQKKAVFTICRGTQLFNVALGGTLNQAIPNHWQETSAQFTSHKIVIDEGNVLSKIYGRYSEINSFHRQSLKDVAAPLEVIARALDDNIIEAVRAKDPNLRFLGVQWHPEFMINDHCNDAELFNYIVNEL